MPLNAKETNPFKTDQQIRRWNRISKSKAAPETKNFQNDARQETLDNWKLNSNMVQNLSSVSKDIFILKMAAWESLYVFNESQSSYLEKSLNCCLN